MVRGQLVRVKVTQQEGVVEGFMTYSSNCQNIYVRFPSSNMPDELYQFRPDSLELVKEPVGLTTPK